MSRIDEALAQKDVFVGNDSTPGESAAVSPTAQALDRYPSQSPEQRTLAAVEREQENPSAALADRCDAALKGKLVVSRDVPPLSIEQYRRLAATLHETQVAQGLKSLIVTSALPFDGKTLTAINLALTLSESYGRRVLLIDADMRRPSLHRAFKLANMAGLGEVLRSEVAELPLATLSKTLAILPAGHSDDDPMQELTSARMRSLLDESEGRFDWVILDAPPVALLPDAQLLSRLTQAVIFVIGAGSTPYAVVDRAIAGLGRECIVGTVLNRVDPQSIPAATYYRRYYHRRATAGA
jgi:protein-tyrosine kinase